MAQTGSTQGQEQLEYGGKKVPIQRSGVAEMYIAIAAPEATPYVMAPHDTPPEDIVRFFSERIEKVEGLQADMVKRFAKSQSERCTYKTGDVAYVMGRPYQIRVVPLSTKGSAPSGGSRGRATVKFSVDNEVSLLTLYVMKTADFDQRRLAFRSYAERVVGYNALRMAAACLERTGAEEKQVPVRFRAFPGRFASLQSGCLWLSHDIVAYPVDCLVYAVWRELAPLSPLSGKDYTTALRRNIPGWERAARMLSDHAKPYSNQ
jgi:hypothetical protein